MNGTSRRRVTSRSVQGIEMLFGDRDLAIIPARSERGELRKCGARVVLLAQLLQYDAEIEGRARIPRADRRRLAQRLRRFLRLARNRERLPQIQQQRLILGIRVDGVATRRN